MWTDISVRSREIFETEVDRHSSIKRNIRDRGGQTIGSIKSETEVEDISGSRENCGQTYRFDQEKYRDRGGQTYRFDQEK